MSASAASEPRLQPDNPRSRHSNPRPSDHRDTKNPTLRMDAHTRPEIVKQWIVVLFGVDRHRKKPPQISFFQTTRKPNWLLRRRTRARNTWPILTWMSLPAHFCTYVHNLPLYSIFRETRMLRLNSSRIISYGHLLQQMECASFESDEANSLRPGSTRSLGWKADQRKRS